MATIAQPLLFGWEEIEILGDLSRLDLVLRNLPDEELMQALEQKRGRGRNDYPVRAMWNSLLAGIVFQHAGPASLRRELLRNGQLRMVCGFDPCRGEKAVPPEWVYSRFSTTLMEHADQVEEIFTKLIWQLGSELPDLGQSLAVDGKAVESAARKRSSNAYSGRRGEHDANWGVKRYTSTGSDGNVCRETRTWFGFKIHTIVDSTYELPLAFEVTEASRAEQPVALDLLGQLEESAPFILDKAEYFSADRGYDDSKLYIRLWDCYQIKPLIAKRMMWKVPDGRDATRAVRSLNGVAYNEKAEVFCYNCYGHRHRMASGGFEKERNALRFLCPARHYGATCCGQSQCTLAKSVRIPIEEDRRIFGPVARDSYKWERLYAKRTAAERVYSRLDVSFGFENHTIRGLDKMKLKISMAYMAMLAMALGRIRQNQPELMRSLVGSG